MKPTMRIALLLIGSCLSACVSSPPSGSVPAPASVPDSATPPRSGTPYNGPGHDLRNAVYFPGVSNPLAFSQKQQEWLWLHYRDWKKLSQSLREQNGIRYDEVTLLNKQGEKRVIYFRMPTGIK